jgi:NADH dehydrogenase FAD-containing subunit
VKCSCRHGRVFSTSSQVNPVKPIANFCQHCQALCEKIQALVQTKPTQKRAVCVVGGDAGGIELLLGVQHAIQRILGPCKNVLETVLVTTGQFLLEESNPQVKTTLFKVLKGRNVKAWFALKWSE